LPLIERSIGSGQRRVVHALAGADVRYIEAGEIARHDPEHLSFFNVNTPEDLMHLRKMM
jgi:molybdopterin-guanine dinucleotide biosynthesis protein A